MNWVKGLVVALFPAAAGNDAPHTNTVGRTARPFAASQTGAATNSMRIWLPQGPNGIQPRMTLVYNCRPGNRCFRVRRGQSRLRALTRFNRRTVRIGAYTVQGRDQWVG